MLLSFDIKGKFAHFRAFYTNSSSLSYYFPPRTTIIGIIASILGYERDSYYDKFSKANLDVSVQLLKPLRKITTTINYLRTKKEDIKKLPIERTLVPIEIIIPENDEFLEYRIYLKFKDKYEKEKLKNYIQNKNFIYSPYLGISEFLAYIENLKEYEEIIEYTDTIHSVLSSDYKNNIDVKNNDYIIIDLMPTDMEKLNNYRRLKSSKEYIVNPKAKPIKLKDKIEAIKCDNNYILWM